MCFVGLYRGILFLVFTANSFAFVYCSARDPRPVLNEKQLFFNLWQHYNEIFTVCTEFLIAKANCFDRCDWTERKKDFYIFKIRSDQNNYVSNFLYKMFAQSDTTFYLWVILATA